MFQHDRLNSEITLFQKINEMGNYADSRWFTDLSYQRLLLFVRELSDIWNYRAELSEEIKIDICPPHGNPFHSVTMVHLQNLSFSYLQNIIISIMESMVNINSTNIPNRIFKIQQIFYDNH